MRIFLSVSALTLVASVGCDAPVSVDAGAADAHTTDARLLGDDGGVVQSDAGTDAFVPLPPVTVTVTDGTTPHAGARVAFFDAAGMLVATATTGADGTVRQALEPGASVVAVPAAPTDNVQAFLWMGVEPGDVLPIVRPLEEGASTETTFRLPPLAGSARWQINTECGVANRIGASITVMIADTCVRSDVVVTYYDASSTVLGTVTALDVPITPGGEVDLTTRMFRPLRAATIAFTGFPPERGYTSFSAWARFGSVIAPEGIYLESSVPGDLSASGNLPDTTEGGLVQQRAQIRVFGGNLFVERIASAATPIAYGDVAMPVISRVDYAPSARRMNLTMTGTGRVLPEASYARLVVSSGGQRVEWNVFAPARDVLTLPTLPASMADAELPLDATPQFDVYRVQGPATFDAMRVRAYTLGSVSDLLEGEGDLIYAYATNRG